MICCCSTGEIRNMQSALTDAQSIPVLGPLVVSPLKAIVSLAQTILGLAATILTALGLILFSCGRNRDLIANTKLFANLTQEGAANFASSVVNFLTLGIAGYVQKHC